MEWNDGDRVAPIELHLLNPIVDLVGQMCVSQSLQALMWESTCVACNCTVASMSLEFLDI